MSKKFNQLFHDSHSWKRVAVFENIQVTPELAGELLRLNGKNRPISNTFVKRYTSDMKEGKWLFGGGSICISREGLIVDGQKRLLSIIDSGTTQTFNIQTGLDPKAFEVMDIGQPRSASDTVAVAGFKNYSVIASAAKLIMAYKDGVLRRQASGGVGDKKYSNAEVLEFCEKKADQELLNEAASAGNRCNYRFKVFSGSTYAAFIYLFGEKDREQAMYFFELLSSGENIGKNSHSMIFILRNKLIQFQSSSTTLRTVDKYALLIKAWNAFRKGKEVAQLVWQPKEDFPVIQ